jgi:hypothetical protein
MDPLERKRNETSIYFAPTDADLSNSIRVAKIKLQNFYFKPRQQDFPDTGLSAQLGRHQIVLTVPG